MSKYGWTEPEPGRILISNQEENIKPKNIVEKIDFDSGLGVLGRGVGHPGRSLGKFWRSWRVLRGFWGVLGYREIPERFWGYWGGAEGSWRRFE